MSPVQDRLTLSLEDVKNYLRIDGSEEDALLEELTASAKAAADAFLNNPFTNPDGTERDIPEPVRSWCLRRVSLLYEQRVEGMRADNVSGLGSADYGRALSDTHGPLDYSLIRPYRRNPGL